MEQTLSYEIAVPVCPACGGKWRYYAGALGYESMVCSKCRLDINDIKIVITKGHNMEAKHTPGSWNYWHKSETDENIVSIHEEHSNLERVIAIVSEEADCPLIASAPELLEELILTKNALRYLIQKARYRAGVPKGILQTAEYHADKADAVIAKVEGRA